MERRRYQRVSLPQPLRGLVGGVRIFVIDLSIAGLRIAHQEPLALTGGSHCHLTFDSFHGPVALECSVTNQRPTTRVKASGRMVHHSGLSVVAAGSESAATVREIVSSCVARALDEQKANARGIPAMAALSYQSGAGTDFVRCELVGDKWRRTRSESSRQPALGFTISASEPEENIVLLCDAFREADADGRKMIQAMAECSVGTPAGIPTRRYMP